jgi:hypothetical protein
MSKAAELAALIGSQTALSNRNLIINGAMQVAQRGTSSTSAGYKTVDRFKNAFSGVAVTQSQETLTSGDPYDAGFRHFYRQTNTSISSATSAYLQIEQRFEAQDISKSAWNYKSSSSHITISFWARSSLAGTYYVQLRTHDGTEYRRNLSFTLVANTWKKIEVTTAGNSNLQIDNDNDSGLTVFITPHYGTDFTGGEEISTTDWFDRNGQADAYYPNYAQNWSNTASATFDITGVQLEVGEQATPFEHESYGTTLAKCQRYFFKFPDANYNIHAAPYTSSVSIAHFEFPVTMRTLPTMVITDGAGTSASTGTSPEGFHHVYNDQYSNFISTFTADAEL